MKKVGIVPIYSQASVTSLNQEMTPMPTVFHRNFQKLLRLIPNLSGLHSGHYLRYEAGDAFMPLSVDVLHREGTRLCIALAHYFEQNGDLVPDPDMELRVDLQDQTVEALTYQDQRVYQEVYPAPGQVRLGLEQSLNAFLSTWLTNIEHQGFRLIKDQPALEQEGAGQETSSC